MDPSALNPSRRGLLWAWIGLCSCAVTGALGSLVGRFLSGAEPPRARPPIEVELGDLAELTAARGPVERTISQSVAEGYFTQRLRRRFYVCAAPSGPFVLSSTCTHLGCTVAWDAARGLFVCPCHGGTYREDGSVAGGPPPRPLSRVPIVVRQGKVYLRIPETA